MNYILSANDLRSASAILRVRGPDANTYLQGQFTQDLKTAKPGPCYGLWLDQKGKVLADSHILRFADDDWLVIALTTPAETLRARLEAYLIADEVELEDVTAAWSSFLLWGSMKPISSLPPGVIRFSSRRAGAGAEEILVPAAHAEAMVATLRPIARDGQASEATLARIRAAVPAVPVDIGPRDLPGEGGLDADAISYTKGCFLGQEVMARLKNLGQVRRALHVVRGTGTPPAPGTALHQGERKLGETRSAAAEGDGFLALAMLSLVNLDVTAALAPSPGGPAEIKILRRV